MNQCLTRAPGSCDPESALTQGRLSLAVVTDRDASLDAAQKKHTNRRAGNRRTESGNERPPNVQRINPLEQPIDAIIEEAVAETEEDIVEERPRSWWKKDS